jgi:translation initiation factor IF-2
MPKKNTQDSNKEVSVLKWQDLLQNTWFLSWLWFGSQVKEEEENKVEEITKEPEQDSIVASVEDFAALMPTPTPSRPRPVARPRPQHGWQQRAPQHGGHQRTPQHGWQQRAPQHGWHQKPHGSYGNNYNRSQQPVKSAPTPAARKPKVAKTSANLVKKDSVVMQDMISVKEFAEKMGVSHLEVMKKLLENKIMVSINSSIDFETATLIAEEFGVGVTKEQATMNVESFMLGDLQAVLDLDKNAEHKAMRPPIVTVMWHVDHGKTSLLDYLRKTNVAAGEAGWITQSIGASVIQHDGQEITFIDTPGHELFTTLRARGAKLTNVAVIVIAADDGIMPQTAESIDHAKAAGVPIIIAVTKIDKPHNNFDRIKTDLGIHDIIPEDWGWDVPVIGVSSVTGQGIPDLLEAILLHSEMLDLQYDPTRAAVWVVLDAHKDAKQWVVSSIIVLTGTLRVGDIIVAYNTYGKVKRMQDWKWKQVKKVTGWEPVQILWLSELPEPGRMVEVVAKEKDAQARVSAIQEKESVETHASVVDQFLQDIQWSEKTELRLILKAEGSSSLDALKQAVQTVEVPDNVVVKIIRSDVGQFTESDLSLAQASKALLLWFDVATSPILKKKAQALQVEMKSFAIIYELTDFLTQLALGMLKKEYEEVFIGKLNVLWVFFRKGKEMVIGWKVLDWHVRNGATFKVMRREGEEMVEFVSGKITSLQKDQTNVKEMAKWHECGMKVRVGKKIEVWDILEFYEMQEKKVEKKKADKQEAPVVEETIEESSTEE